MPEFVSKGGDWVRKETVTATVQKPKPQVVVTGKSKVEDKVEKVEKVENIVKKSITKSKPTASKVSKKKKGR